MFRGRFLAAGLFTLVLIGLLVAGGYSLVRVGWAQGYTAGLEAGPGAEALPVVPYAVYPRFGWFGFGFFPFFCGIPLLFFGGLFLLRFLFFGRFMRGWGRGGWGRGGWRRGEGWGDGWGPGRRPPWADEGEASEEEVDMPPAL